MERARNFDSDVDRSALVDVTVESGWANGGRSGNIRPKLPGSLGAPAVCGVAASAAAEDEAAPSVVATTPAPASPIPVRNRRRDGSRRGCVSVMDTSLGKPRGQRELSDWPAAFIGAGSVQQCWTALCQRREE